MFIQTLLYHHDQYKRRNVLRGGICKLMFSIGEGS